jgi:four helix bundle protein
MHDFRQLHVWDVSRAFAIDIYRITRTFPAEELYDIVSQLRRASASIGANIAEGAGRGSDAAFCQFLRNSLGSAKECQHFLILAKELSFVNEQDFTRLYNQSDEVARMLSGLLKRLR